MMFLFVCFPLYLLFSCRAYNWLGVINQMGGVLSDQVVHRLLLGNVKLVVEEGVKYFYSIHE